MLVASSTVDVLSSHPLLFTAFKHLIPMTVISSIIHHPLELHKVALELYLHLSVLANYFKWVAFQVDFSVQYPLHMSPSALHGSTVLHHIEGHAPISEV